MSRVIILLGSLLLVCCDGHVTSEMFNEAKTRCEPNGGIKFFTADFTDFVSLTCNNQAQFSFKYIPKK